KEQSGVMEDEVHALLHVVKDFGDCAFIFGGGVLVDLGAALNDGGSDEGGGCEEADGVKRVAEPGAEVGNEQAGGGRADDPHAEHDGLHEGVGGTEAVERHCFSYHHALSRSEETG